MNAKDASAAAALADRVPAAGRVIAFRSPWATAERTIATGVLLGCVSMAAWFLPLFAAVVRMRFVRGDWVDEIVLHEVRPWVALGSAGLVCAALLLRAADRDFSRRGPRRASIPTAAAALLGFVSIGTQVFGSETCARMGCGAHGGPEGSILFGLAGLNIVLASIGTVAIAWIGAKAARGAYHPGRPSPFAGWGFYFQTLAVLSAVGLLLAFGSLSGP